MERQIKEEKDRMKKYWKKCSTSLVIAIYQNKNDLKYNFTPEVGKMKKSENYHMTTSGKNIILR